ncbi:uncharacterized protein LOC124920446 [Impatiens glandulifera]|uniref:uncharacterized protein LOC124920446 n=1 Tax=Impatiens glandulifera TaxID=253017 RepID=UPI001FB155BB|nr:uncharacterized protein LOC124920446 [Impatiens glandulifera]
MKISSEENEEHISPTNHLLQSLIHSIPQVQTFKGKWSLIKSKLLILQTHITDFSNFTSNTISLDLLHSIHNTLSDSISLCESCKDLTLPNGKLRTQNDVDSISTRLDRHIHDADLLLKSGVLDDDNNNNNSSLSLSVRAEIRCLITRLQIGSSDSRNSAMDSVMILLHGDDKNVLIAVGQGIVPVLVRLLDSLSSHELKEKTVAALARVSSIDSNKSVLIDEGLLLLNNLCRVLESGSGFAKEKACIVLKALSHAKENARAIGSRGGISSLLEICQSGTPSSQAAAAGVCRNLSEFAEIKENFIEENAIPILLSLLASGTSSAQENAIGCLSLLICNDTQLKLFIAKEGGIESLKNYWDSSPSIRNLEVAVDMVKNLASCPLIAETLITDGFLNRLIPLLNCGVLSIRTVSANAIYELSFNSRTRKELDSNYDSNCIPSLVKMLDGKAIEEREAAAKALSSLMGYAGNRRLFRKEGRGIMGTIQLLDPSVEKLDKKYPVLILTSLVKSNKCRKEMIAGRACIYLQKLCEIGDVEGAKKLLENLGKGKLFGGLFG